MRRTKKSLKKYRFGIAVSRFNEFITARLLKGCLAEFGRRGVLAKQLKVVWVPGAFELPLICQKLAQRRDIDAVIALGAVIRGETFHFELVAQAAKDGILKVSLKTGKPVIFGVLTTENTKQAYARSKERGDNKGRDAAQAALDMVDILAEI